MLQKWIENNSGNEQQYILGFITYVDVKCLGTIVQRLGNWTCKNTAISFSRCIQMGVIHEVLGPVLY